MTLRRSQVRVLYRPHCNGASQYSPTLKESTQAVGFLIPPSDAKLWGCGWLMRVGDVSPVLLGARVAIILFVFLAPFGDERCPRFDLVQLIVEFSDDVVIAVYGSLLQDWF